VITSGSCSESKALISECIEDCVDSNSHSKIAVVNHAFMAEITQVDEEKVVNEIRAQVDEMVGDEKRFDRENMVSDDKSTFVGKVLDEAFEAVTIKKKGKSVKDNKEESTTKAFVVGCSSSSSQSKVYSNGST
jgi:hypothetical protein